MSRKIATNIMLTQKQYTALKNLSAKHGIPMAELIRRAIDAALEPSSWDDQSNKPS